MKNPRRIAFLNSFSWPLISILSSGIAVKPRRENNMTPIGSVKFPRGIAVKFAGLMSLKCVINNPRMIAMIAMTPYVSTFLRLRRPSCRRSVMTSQNTNPISNGLMFPGRSC